MKQWTRDSINVPDGEPLSKTSPEFYTASVARMLDKLRQLMSSSSKNSWLNAMHNCDMEAWGGDGKKCRQAFGSALDWTGISACMLSRQLTP